MSPVKKDEDTPDPAPTPTPTPQGVGDIDGNRYDTLTIGGLTWFTENLRVRNFRNGDPIPFDTSNAYWGTLETFCTVLDNDMANEDQFGLLYNYRAVTDPRGLCPDGWHPSTDGDWGALELALGMDPSEVGMNSYPTYGERGVAANVSGKLKALQLWPTLDGTVTNSSGMAVLPARSRAPQQGGFNTSASAYFWTSTSGWYRQLSDGTPGVIRRSPGQSSDTPGAGYSCRCVKD
ncbi:MAG: fibrobacter succinogenes major paralogous domain-containing protein [Flavobacteriales bacterium]|nr:fibrobacter succinogenes major paralogous domain-containing protein [Flavobacteriales bacterium]